MYSFPIQVAWEVTGQCQLKCIYCLNNSGSCSADLTPQERMRVANELVENNILDIIISGGEPLLIPDIFNLLEKLKSSQAQISLLTNGLLLNNETCKQLSPLVDFLQVSLDSLRPEVQEKLTTVQGSHAAIMRGIECALSHKLPLMIGAVINKLNFNEMGDLAEFCIEKRVVNLSISEMMPIGRARKNFEELSIGDEERIKAFHQLQPYKEKIKISGHEPGIVFRLGGKEDCRCACSQVSCSISFEGDVFPCSYIRQPVGSVKKSSLKSIWQGDFCGYRDLMSKPPSGKCAFCEKSSSCGGGCKGLSWGYAGRVDAPNPICVYHQV